MTAMKKKNMLILAMAAALLAPGIIRADDDANPAKKPSPSLVQIEDEPGLPRVLLIGDSISQGYTLEVRALLKGKANVHRPPTNCGGTSTSLGNIDGWLGNKKWDVIHFNWGLHDMKYLKPGRQNVPPDKYEKNLATLIGKMKKKATTLIFATTTPVSEKQGGIYPRNQGDVAKYNEIALRVMKASGVPVNDLNAVITPGYAGYASKDGVHFNKNGCSVLAKAVAESIEKHLPPATLAK